MDSPTENKNVGHLAKASTQSAPVSTKHCIEICSYLRYKKISEAKKFLEGVIAHKLAVPFKKFKRNVGHKPGMAAGRFPQKAAREVLRLVKGAEANAQFKGLNRENLKITKILANRAPAPFTGNRHHHSTKRTHLEIEVVEYAAKKQPAPAEKKTENKKSSRATPQKGEKK
jgi:large subunit ribosomal protein L22